MGSGGGARGARQAAFPLLQARVEARIGPVIAELHASAGVGPPLVYVPGIDGTGEFLFGTAAALERRHRLLRLRYAAARPAGAAVGPYPALAASVVGVLDEARVERALLLAESFGGAVALQVALDFPERVRALAIVNGFAWYPKRIGIGLSSRSAAWIPATLFRLVRQSLGPYLLLGQRRQPDVVRAFRALAPSRLDASYARRLEMIRLLDLRPRLPEIRCPVALFASDRDRIVPALATSAEIQAHIHGATLERIEHAGHVILPFDAPLWLARLEELARRGT
jgi:3-oxoadipate enol-lactonase